MRLPGDLERLVLGRTGLRGEPGACPAFGPSFEEDPVVKTARPALPKLDRLRRQPEAAPVRGSWHLVWIHGGQFFSPRCQGGPVSDLLALGAGGGRQLAPVGSASKVLVGLGCGDLGDRPFDPRLALKLGPKERHRREGIGREFLSLPALVVRVEDKAVVQLAKQDDPVGWAAILTGGRQSTGGLLGLPLLAGLINSESEEGHRV